jgi:predicted  nucleic acid-binding Zn-ribbon protein
MGDIVAMLANIIAAISTVIAAASLAVAYFQLRQNKHKMRTERERIASHREKIRSAFNSAEAAFASADMIVQRGKDDNASVVELQNLIRILRGNLRALAYQLQTEERSLKNWEYGRFFHSAADDVSVD